MRHTLSHPKSHEQRCLYEEHCGVSALFPDCLRQLDFLPPRVKNTWVESITYLEVNGPPESLLEDKERHSRVGAVGAAILRWQCSSELCLFFCWQHCLVNWGIWFSEQSHLVGCQHETLSIFHSSLNHCLPNCLSWLKLAFSFLRHLSEPTFVSHLKQLKQILILILKSWILGFCF